MSDRGCAGFPRSARLLTAADYARLFNRPEKSVDRRFTVLWKPNGTADGRLGLAIAKRVLRRAVDRNRIKRQVRESFRRHREQLAGIDVLVMVRRGVDPADREGIARSLVRHWRRIAIQFGAADS